ncbi:MAG TPA: hypothetical protein VHZ78_15430 [Rhizomicrobium sp.]|jgi:hypothetical protein|nr:hypothetical protein [Rhizomicrobium sp.]
MPKIERHHWLGLGGILLLILGAFAPAAPYEGHGEVTAYGGGHGDGIFVIALAVVSLVPLFGKRRLLLLIPAVLAAALVIFMFFDMRARLGQTELGVGWVLLGLGAASLLAAGTVPRKP